VPADEVRERHLKASYRTVKALLEGPEHDRNGRRGEFPSVCVENLDKATQVAAALLRRERDRECHGADGVLLAMLGVKD